MSTRRPLVALAGNPNTGKTTLFNRLTGAQQKVGNYAGVTVERVSGVLQVAGGQEIELLDVPGTYSLAAKSKEEELALKSLAGIGGEPAPDAVLLVLDATQLSRNLYLALQVLELRVPVIIALNMADELAKRGQTLDVGVLEHELGVPVVLVSALHDRDLGPLLARLGEALAGRATQLARPQVSLSPVLQAAVHEVAQHVPEEWLTPAKSPANAHLDARRHAFAAWALLSLEERDELDDVPANLRAQALRVRTAYAAQGHALDDELVAARYAWIDERLPRMVRTAPTTKPVSEQTSVTTTV